MNDSQEAVAPARKPPARKARARKAAIFKEVRPDRLSRELSRALATTGPVPATNSGDLIVNAYADGFRAGRPTGRWQTLVDKALAKLNARRVKVISVPIERDDSVLQPWNIRLRGVPAMIAFKAGQPVPVQYLGAPDLDKLTSWIGKSLGLARGFPDASCEDDPPPAV